MVNKPQGNTISQANVLAEHLLQYWEGLVFCIFNCLFDLFRIQSFVLAVGQLCTIGDTEPLAMRPPQMLLLHSYFNANLSAGSVIHPRKAL